MSVNNAIARYNMMAEDSQKNSERFGCSLPMMTQGNLTLTSQSCSLLDVFTELKQWKHAEGWYQTIAETVLGMPPEGSRLLEGEWHRQGNSLHIRHEYADRYYLTQMITQPLEIETQQCYRDQELFIRRELSSEKNRFLRYRLWWQMGVNGEKEGLWQPLAQQFVGFSGGKQ